MKRLYLLLIMLLAVHSTFASAVDSVRARAIAENFLLKVAENDGGELGNGLVNATGDTPFQNIYLFVGADGHGFVLVAADDVSVPILGYSRTSVFETGQVPEHIMEWLLGYDNQISVFGTGSEDSVATDDGWHITVWDDEGEEILLPSSVRPLISTTWNQTSYYNAMCPNLSSGSKCATGCVSTATAQIMKYWNWPLHGQGQHSYNTSYGVLSADFEHTTYDWENMPNYINGSSSIAQINAVATLIYHVGVALETNYGSTSTAYTNPNNAGLPSAESVLKDYFGYSASLGTILRSQYSSDEEWSAVLKAELNASRPILYSGHGSGGGHSFIVDGYDENGMFHINWGWGGFCDGYYVMGSLNPGVGGTGSGSLGAYNSNNKAIIGIMPEGYTNHWVNIDAIPNNPSWGRVTGSGSYESFVGNVTLTASAYDGYRFVGWTDGISLNPRSFVATSMDEQYMAIFEPVEGDTLYYCLNNRSVCLDFRHWGIRIPYTMLSPNQELRQVQAFLPSSGNYVIEIYYGFYPFPHLVYSQPVVSYTPGMWNTFTLLEPLVLSGEDNLWITISSPDVAYPVACSGWSGNPDGQYCSNDGVRWYELGSAGSCMVRGLFHTPILVDELDPDEPSTPSSPNGVIEIGSESSSQQSAFMPVCTNSRYSLVEIILTSSELGGSNEFDGISFYYNSSTPLSAKSNCKIYIQPVSVNLFWSDYNMEYVSSSAVLVYSGPLNCTTGWNKFDFTTPYSYNGEDNLLIIIQDNSGSKQNYCNFKVDYCGSPMTLSYYRDLLSNIMNNPYFPNAEKERFSVRPVMRLWGVEEDTVALQYPVDLDSEVVVHDTVYVIDTIECSTYSLSVAMNDSSMGVCCGSGVFHRGMSVEIMAMPYSGRRFVGWSDGQTENPRHLTVDSNMVVTAIFEPLVPDGDWEDDDDLEDWDDGSNDDDDLGGSDVELDDAKGGVVDNRK